MVAKPRARSSSKETSDDVASLAGRVLEGYRPKRDEIEALAASALAQTEKRNDASLPRGKRVRGSKLMRRG